MKDQFDKDEIETINDCLSTYHEDDTMTFERATFKEICECVEDEYFNNEYHYDMICCDLRGHDRELIAYVEGMCDVAYLHGKIEMLKSMAEEGSKVTEPQGIDAWAQLSDDEANRLGEILINEMSDMGMREKLELMTYNMPLSEMQKYLAQAD